VTELSVSVAVEDGAGGPRTIVSLVGEADATTPALGETLRAEAAKKPRVLLIDGTRLTFVDSAALHEIVLACRRVKASDGLFALISPAPEVARILHLTGLDTVVPVHASFEQAERGNAGSGV
jgi:anti-anti-sigma factor